jgi:hypothetical protein
MLRNSLHGLKSDNFVDRFDAVIIAWPKLDHRMISDSRITEEIDNARLIVFVGLQSENHREIYGQLLVRATHVVLDNATDRDDYVILGKKAVVKWQENEAPTYWCLPI